MSRATSGLRGLYGITDSNLLNSPQRLQRAVEAAFAGGMRVLQYRDKQADAATRLHNAEMLRRLCEAYGGLLIINDDSALAQAVDAHGVHLGRSDGSIERARALLGEDAIIGLSCYNQVPRALAAQAAGCDYVAFGRFFPSLTKPDAVHARPEMIGEAKQQLELPLCAIGGITTDNAPALIEQGADMLAVIHGLFAAENTADIEQTARRFSELLLERLND